MEGTDRTAVAGAHPVQVAADLAGPQGVVLGGKRRGQLPGGPGALLPQERVQRGGDLRLTDEVGRGPRMLAPHCRQAGPLVAMQRPAHRGETTAKVCSDLCHRPAARGQEQYLDPVAFGRLQGGIAPQNFDGGALIRGESKLQHASTLP